MPYVLVKYEEVRHRCTVGDAGSDPELMKILDAEVRQSGDAWKFVSLLAPRLVLNKLETQGYRVITCTSKGDEKHEGFILWTLHKEEGDGPPDYDRLTEYTGGKSAASSRSAQKWVWKPVLCYFLLFAMPLLILALSMAVLDPTWVVAPEAFSAALATENSKKSCWSRFNLEEKLSRKTWWWPKDRQSDRWKKSIKKNRPNQKGWVDT